MILRLAIAITLVLLASPAEAIYRGDYAAGVILNFKFTTVTTTGAPV
jgi:hypothetical protein